MTEAPANPPNAERRRPRRAPHMLTALRHNLGDELRSATIVDIDKDLTKHSAHEIERLLTDRSSAEDT
ncbi:host attachment protein (plasmid) [Bosea sp. F3-2]|uniref:host attachment protein n=1 Tax=Bosea sp. F3-2 TaxID=2599640 RepID=UPI0011EF604F|nr:host attachment protein [Bosea sp. F3-2]QEL27176.1 host attachment protein [Bosea sp. F3-2]